MGHRAWEMSLTSPSDSPIIISSCSFRIYWSLTHSTVFFFSLIEETRQTQISEDEAAKTL